MEGSDFTSELAESEGVSWVVREQRWMFFFSVQNKELNVWEALIALLISDIRAAGVCIWMKNIWTPGLAAQGAAATKGALIVGESVSGFSVTCSSLITYFELIIWNANYLIPLHLADILSFPADTTHFEGVLLNAAVIQCCWRDFINTFWIAPVCSSLRLIHILNTKKIWPFQYKFCILHLMLWRFGQILYHK